MHRTCLLAATASLAVAPCAHAADEEIQVYMDELTEPGHLGLDLHVNHVLSGQPGPDYPGGEAALHRLRITPELSVGLSKTWDIGFYLPLTTLASDGTYRVQGAKLRIKWMAPHKAEGFYGGANFEIGRVAHRLDENPWNGELKLIGGWRRGPWELGVNGNFDFVVSGPAPTPATFDLSSRIGYRVAPRLVLGVENYTGFGPLKSLGHFGRNEHASFVTADTTLGKWDVQLGLGKAYGTSTDNVIAKLIIGVPIP